MLRQMERLMLQHVNRGSGRADDRRRACGRGRDAGSGGGSGVLVRGTASVFGVDLVVHPGECVVLTGPSGCGKTTLTRMVNGLIPALYGGEMSGEVRVQGISMDRWEMDDLSCVVGSVFQNPRSQFFNLDTTSEVAFGCENMGVRRTRCTCAWRPPCANFPSSV